MITRRMFLTIYFTANKAELLFLRLYQIELLNMPISTQHSRIHRTEIVARLYIPDRCAPQISRTMLLPLTFALSASAHNTWNFRSKTDGSCLRNNIQSQHYIGKNSNNLANQFPLSAYTSPQDLSKPARPTDTCWTISNNGRFSRSRSTRNTGVDHLKQRRPFHPSEKYNSNYWI